MRETSLDQMSARSMKANKKYIIYYKSDYSLTAVIEAPNKIKAKKIFANSHLPGIVITAVREATAV